MTEGSECDRNIAAMDYADIDSSSHLPVDLPVSVDRYTRSAS